MINTWRGRLEEYYICFLCSNFNAPPKWSHAASHWVEIHPSISFAALHFVLNTSSRSLLALTFIFLHHSPLWFLLLPSFTLPLFLQSLHLLHPSFSLPAPLIIFFCHVYGANSGGSWQFPNCFMRYCRSRCAVQKKGWQLSWVLDVSGETLWGMEGFSTTCSRPGDAENERERGGECWPTAMRSDKGRLLGLQPGQLLWHTHTRWQRFPDPDPGDRAILDPDPDGVFHQRCVKRQTVIEMEVQ